MNSMNNMNGNYNGYGMGYNQPGTQYGQFPSAKMTQPLTAEQIKELRSTGSGFNLKVDPVEILRSHCTHKDRGNITLSTNADGSSTCTICGATFNLIDKDVMEIKDITQAVIDVLQSIKTYYLDIPENYVKDYFNMIPFLEKLPKFYEVALHNFAKYENGAFLNQNNNMYGFQVLNALTSPGYGNQMNPAMMNQQMAMNNQMMGQPQMMGQQNPMLMNQQMPGMNPFGGVQQDPNMMNNQMMGQPQMAPQPQMTVNIQQPTVQPNQVAEQPTVQPNQVITTKSFNI